ncbi:DNA-binding protein [Tuber borchii]|uniref:DNA-binding protein n=1 Tax=Tuber borchii TaxID=42251 RepID=A0A2T6ZGC9_TUBBO|nr:DNA-binding protein [Tuber borchii]
MEPLPKLTEGRSVISSYPDLLSTLTDFLTVCIHTILYHRNIYPPELYIKARKYSFPVYQSRHERVCKWIADAVGAVAGEIAKGNVSKVSLIIISPRNIPLERYVFDLSAFPNVPFEGGYGDLLLQQLAEVGGGVGGEEKKRLDEITIAGLEAQFRACLMKLSVAAPDLGRLPEDCTYTVAMEMKEPGAPINYAEVWVPAEGQGSDGTGIRHGGGTRSTAIRTVEAGSICLELSIEETTTKTKMVFGQ